MSDLPFEPLIAPRVAPKNPAPPTPVNWFQYLAPRLLEEAAGEEMPSGENAAGDQSGVRRVAFGDVEAIAADVRRRQQMGEPEPPEITMLRLKANEEAQEIVGEAFLQGQAIEQKAEEQGYQAGYVQGYLEGEREAQRILTQRADDERAAYREDLKAFIARIEAERQRAWEEIEPQVIGLVFELAQKVIKQEITASREVALSMIKNALRRVAESGALRIRVHASDLETVRSHREDLMSLLDGIHHLEIIEDRRVSEGGCIVETEAGNIDTRVETQLKEVADTLEQMVTHRASQE
jgi:flagellar assembly protein FliH